MNNDYYCPTTTCDNIMSRYGSGYCRDCGTELTKCVPCVCGQEFLNLKYEVHWLTKSLLNPKRQPHHCGTCGVAWDHARLSERMSTTLRELVQRIGSAKSVAVN